MAFVFKVNNYHSRPHPFSRTLSVVRKIKNLLNHKSQSSRKDGLKFIDISPQKLLPNETFSKNLSINGINVALLLLEEEIALLLPEFRSLKGLYLKESALCIVLTSTRKINNLRCHTP